MPADQRYSIEGQPVVPVIWLDTHAVSDLAVASGRDEVDERPQAIRERLLDLRHSGEVFSFESDQMVEIEVVEHRVDHCARLLSDLSQGVTTSYLTVQRVQRQIGMTAFVEAGPATIPWASAFDDDPFRGDISNELIVRVDVRPSDMWLEQRRANNETIANRWEELRQQNLAAAGDRRAKLSAQVEAELSAMGRVVTSTWTRLANGDSEVDADLAAMVTEYITLPLADLRALGGQHLGIDDLVEFYKSDHYRELPFVRIESELMARLVTGNEPIKPSDVMDVHSIAAFLPYCSHMVIDSAKIEAVRSLRLDQRYGTKVLKLLELGTVLNAEEAP